MGMSPNDIRVGDVFQFWEDGYLSVKVEITKIEQSEDGRRIITDKVVGVGEVNAAIGSLETNETHLWDRWLSRPLGSGDCHCRPVEKAATMEILEDIWS